MPTSVTTREVQQALTVMHQEQPSAFLSPGAIDNVWGPNTERAFRNAAVRLGANDFSTQVAPDRHSVSIGGTQGPILVTGIRTAASAYTPTRSTTPAPVPTTVITTPRVPTVTAPPALPGIIAAQRTSNRRNFWIAMIIGALGLGGLALYFRFRKRRRR